MGAWKFAWVVSKRSVKKEIKGWTRISSQILNGEHYTNYTSGSDALLGDIKKALKDRKDIVTIVDSTPEDKRHRKIRKRKLKSKQFKTKDSSWVRTKYDYPAKCDTSQKKSAYRRRMRKENKGGQ